MVGEGARLLAVRIHEMNMDEQQELDGETSPETVPVTLRVVSMAMLLIFDFGRTVLVSREEFAGLTIRLDMTVSE